MRRVESGAPMEVPQKRTEERRRIAAGILVLAITVSTLVIHIVVSGSLHIFSSQEGPLAKSLAQLKEQTEQSYWENVGFDMDALSQLPRETFATSLVIIDSLGYRQKYIWDYFMPHYACPQKEKVGTLARDGDHGKWLCGVRSLLQRPGCVVYSVGSNGDVSFEQGLRNRTQCEIHVFDPTLTPEQKQRVMVVPGIQLHEYGLGASDGWIDTSRNPTMTIGKGMAGFKSKTLPTIMRELGHTWVDVLKIDIEGSEWDVLDSLLRQPGPLPFTQLQVEYHNFHDGRVAPEAMLNVMARMITKDMRVFNVEPNLWGINNGYDFVEYAYLQVDKDGNVAAGPAHARSKRASNRRAFNL